MENAHAKTSEELFQFFGTGPDGLSEIKNAESAIKALKEYEPEMAKVIRSEKHGIQMIRAKELVPGDVVEVS
uniref:Uncharacterized protein n=1 Tax=Meloidogyne javanica TaxID=6303 RepID=A0A915MH16_MELJA